MLRDSRGEGAGGDADVGREPDGFGGLKDLVTCFNGAFLTRKQLLNCQETAVFDWKSPIISYL